MANNIAGFGLTINVIASNTFPNGFDINVFSDDGDPLDVAEIAIAETSMGLNGDLLSWSKATPIQVKLSVVAMSIDDINLGIVLENNRVGKGKTSAYDLIQLTSQLPNGTGNSFGPGKLTKGMPGESVTSAGKVKTKTYSFEFENRTAVSVAS